MRKNLFWLLVSILMVLSLVLASCAEEVEEEEEEEEIVVEEEEEEVVVEEEEEEYVNWWEDKWGEPEYGGTIMLHDVKMPNSFDYNYGFALFTYWYEHLLTPDWTTDRNVCDFKTGWASPEYYTGFLLESVEWTDTQTMIGHVREGIYWQNKPPVNGREFTAYDIQNYYEWIFGQGSYTTGGNPLLLMWGEAYENATATDKYTVTFKFKHASIFNNLGTAQDQSLLNAIVCPEVIQLGSEGMSDWKNAAGTGAFILTDFVNGSSMTLDKNPDYWGYDERYPENRLPYADSIKILCIPDTTTALAALRTGKLDCITSLTRQQAQVVAERNPEIMQTSKPAAGNVIKFKCNAEPFTDIRVRKALQMAIDRETIAETYYGGVIDGKPAGLIPPGYTGWTIPYDEWPAELQAEYSYNPERARELLAEAGYPDGFQTNLITSSDEIDIGLLEIIKAQFYDIGVDMEIKVMEHASYYAYLAAKKYDQMTVGGWVAMPRNPRISLIDLVSTQELNSTDNNDPTYDAIYARFLEASSVEEAKEVVIEADMYVLEHHWGAVTFPQASFVAWQPYLKGYDGENMVADSLWPRLWIDYDLKKSMGY